MTTWFNLTWPVARRYLLLEGTFRRRPNEKEDFDGR